MSMKETIIDKLKNRTAVIGVVGLGYVGLPLAVEKAKAGYRVIGFDIQQKRCAMVNEGHNYIGDVVDEDLKNLTSSGGLVATTDYSRIAEVDAVAIAVPTPLDKYKQPDTSYVINSTTSVAEHLHRGMLVVLESTTYPGTTEEIVRPILEKTGLKCGEDFYLAFSPERVDPGNKQFKTKNTPKVVGGVTKDCTEVAATMYRNVLEGEIFEVSSPAVAEMEKILENTFRNINVALANEMAILCERMGIDVWEVIDAAKTKPYGFMAFYPGPGLGGHCIPIDPFYLTWKAREYDYHTKLIEIAGEINDSMPEFVVEKAGHLLNDFKTNSTIHVNDIIQYLYNYLPEDIVVTNAEEVDERFHSQYNVVSKKYTYRIWNNKYHDPFLRKYTAHVQEPLDNNKMRRATAYLIGEHDFTSFHSTRSQKKSSQRTIYSITIENKQELIEITCHGNGFLHNMVRIITGTLIEVGAGRIKPEYLKDILEKKDRTLAGPTAPSKGLFLVDVEY